MMLRAMHVVAGVLVLALWPVAARQGGGPSQPVRGNPEGQPGAPTVEVSAISVSPPEIHETPVGHGPAAAVVTVQIFHLAASTPQTIRLNVGTYSTAPASGVLLGYSPPSQTVTIPAGAAGRVVATARIASADIGRNADATAVVAATLTQPSRGLRVTLSPPDNWRATVRIKNP